MSEVKYFIVVTDGALKGMYLQPSQFAAWNVKDIIGLEGTPGAWDDEETAQMMADALVAQGMKVAVERGGPSESGQD